MVANSFQHNLNTMKTIVIPTDFSANAWNAMRYAAALFQEEAVHYLLLNTYTVPTATVDSMANDFLLPLCRASEEGLETVLSAFSALKHNGKTTFEIASACGEVSTIVKNSVENKTDTIVVMGTLGARGAAGFLMGTNTHAVIRKVNCPVICIPEKAIFYPPANIVFAADYQNIDNLNCLHPMHQLAKEYQSEITLVNVQQTAEISISVTEAEEGLNLHAYLASIPHSYSNYVAKDIADGVLEFSDRHRADLLVVLKREHDLWEKLFNKSVTKRVAFHTETPLMVLHETRS